MDRYVTHATFSLERSYPVSAARVFAAWADPAAKARWFAPGPDSGHQLDFRVGGREVNARLRRGRRPPPRRGDRRLGPRPAPGPAGAVRRRAAGSPGGRLNLDGPAPLSWGYCTLAARALASGAYVARTRCWRPRTMPLR